MSEYFFSNFPGLTLWDVRRIIYLMKRIPTKENGFFKRLVINIPFVLIVALIVACFFAAATLVFYGIVCTVAFKSAMICLILLGAAFILAAAGLGLILGFKAYYKFYDRVMGWQYVDTAHKEEETPTSSVVSDKKPISSYFTLSNISLAILAVGAVLTIISAALGSINRENWVKAIGPYREAHGYYEDVHRLLPEYQIENIATHKCTLTTINIDFNGKQAVIIYTTEQERLGKVSVVAYTAFEGQLSFSISKDLTTLSLVESPPPDRRKTTLDKLLFFADDILKTIPSENQVLIYVPENFKDDIKIVGDYIVAKD